MWYNGKKRPGCIRSPGIHLTTFYENGLRLNRIALSKKSDSAEHLSQTAYVLEPVPQRGKLVIFPRCVYTVVNGNVAHFVFGENNLYQFAGFQIIKMCIRDSEYSVLPQVFYPVQHHVFPIRLLH